MKTILVPTDFSANALAALHYAAAVAAQVRGNIILFHNAAMQVNFSDFPTWSAPDQDLMEFYQAKLNKVANALRLEHGFKFEVSASCHQGSLIENLNKLVKEKGVDLVIMGTKGATSMMDKFLGTVAATYLQEAICPVIVVPAQTHIHAPARIAYASDFEREERVYLKQLRAVGVPLQAEITVVNITEEYELNVVADDQIMAEIEEELHDNNFQFEQVQADDVVKGLEEFVISNKIDVLAVASREHTQLEQFFYRSVTERLAFQATVPLLVLPPNPYNIKQLANPSNSKA